MLIHFVCRGNTFRSRMAEAYLKSRHLPGVSVISSGIEAQRNFNGPITWEAERIIKRCGLIPYLKTHWTKTTNEQIVKSDLVIFMDRSVYHFCTVHFGIPKWHEVWDIDDIDEAAIVADPSLKKDEGRIRFSEHVFAVIVNKTDALAAKLAKTVRPV